MQNFNVGILLFPGVELLDFAGPHEVFSATKDATGFDFFHVFTVAKDEGNIISRNGLEVVPDYTFLFHPPIQILIVPGGEGSKAIIGQDAYLTWLEKVHENTMLTTSVCSGARLLARAGLLHYLQATTHHSVAEDIRQLSPSTQLDLSQRFIEQGRIITAGGISAGIDMALHVVKKFFGGKIAHQIQIYMEYGDWRTL